MSGASLNEKKTKFLGINSKYKSWNGIDFVNSLKILRIEFIKSGISSSNAKNAILKLNLALEIWNNLKLNLMERITVIKPFAFSKIIFISNFYIVYKEQIKQIEKILFSYIWNKKRELVSRKNLCHDYIKGGLRMFDLNAKFESIRYKFFLDIRDNISIPQYQLSIFFYKIHP